MISIESSLVFRLEACGRICYKSEDLITEDSALPFVKKIAAHGHNSVLEMAVVTSARCPVLMRRDRLFLVCQPKFLFVDKRIGRITDHWIHQRLP